MGAKKKPVVFAHRGASAYCPENTMAAFSKAIELGATGIETDVQMTKDGRLVLIHDETLQRTAAGQGYVKEINFHDLRLLDAGSWFHPDFKQERVPSLEEFFEFVKLYNVVLNLELKNDTVHYPEMERQVIDCIRQYRVQDRVVLSSFNHYSLVTCKHLAPEIETGALYMEALYEPWKYALQIGATALHPYKLAFHPSWIETAARHGIQYRPFTVNDPEEMRFFIDCGVDGIFTDYPDKAVSFVK